MPIDQATFRRTSGVCTALRRVRPELPELGGVFGLERLRPGQEKALASLLEGRDTLVVMPTGGGKSLIYQLASYYVAGTTVVVSPLIALMEDQLRRLEELGVAAAALHSSVPAQQLRQRLEALEQGRLRLVYITPERLRCPSFRLRLTRARIGLLAVDEAHCVSQWGHDFRPDYLSIAEARRELGWPLTVALTATATAEVQQDVARLLELEAPCRIVTGFDRPNLHLEVRGVTGTVDKLRHIRSLLAAAGGASIVYTGTRKAAEELSRALGSDHYHGGLDMTQRRRIGESFCRGPCQVVVATNAFGMGIDRPDIRLVVHHWLPGSLEAYYQEAGRAGRDGAPAEAVMLFDPQDAALHRWFIRHSYPTREELEKVRSLLGHPEEPPAAAASRLAGETGMPRVRVRVALELCRQDPTLEESLGRCAVLRERRRLHLAQVLDYARQRECRRHTILSHFGEPMPPPGNRCCDRCDGPAGEQRATDGG